MKRNLASSSSQCLTHSLLNGILLKRSIARYTNIPNTSSYIQLNENCDATARATLMIRAAKTRAPTLWHARRSVSLPRLGKFTMPRNIISIANLSRHYDNSTASAYYTRKKDLALRKKQQRLRHSNRLRKAIYIYTSDVSSYRRSSRRLTFSRYIIEKKSERKRECVMYRASEGLWFEASIISRVDSRESFLLAFIDGVRVRIVWNGIDILFFYFLN